MPAQLHRGDVVLVPFPFADLTGQKLRPAVVISTDPQSPKLVVAFITSVLTNRSARVAEVELLQSDPEFRMSGLKADSLIRLDQVVTLSNNMISRRLGSVGSRTLLAIAASICHAFGL